MQHLLKVVRSGASGARLSGPRGAYATRTLSFLSGNVPRDRRGRIAHRPGPLSLDETGSDLEDDNVTPRLGLGHNAEVCARERERELLESLRSPDPPEARQSGGWGLGAWDESISAREKDDDDEDEQMDLEQAQVRPPDTCAVVSLFTHVFVRLRQGSIGRGSDCPTVLYICLRCALKSDSGHQMLCPG